MNEQAASAAEQPQPTTALTQDGAAAQADPSVLSRQQRQLLDQLRQGQDVTLLLRTGSSVDTGGWLRAGQVFLALTDDALLLFAEGRRPVTARVAFLQLGQSLYNHVTGQLVLAPASDAAVKAVALKPQDARRVLHRIGAKEAFDV